MVVKRIALSLCAPGLCALTLLKPTPALAETVEDFYRGKTISLYVGFPPAGGYDIYARIMAPHLGRHVPGQSHRHRPEHGRRLGRAGGGLHTECHAAGRHLARHVPRHHHLGKVLGGPGDFDPVKLTGSAASLRPTRSPWSGTRRRRRPVEEAKRTRSSSRSRSRARSTSMIAAALNDLVGTKFRLVRGYPGLAEAWRSRWSAARSHAMGGMSWDAVKATKQDWLEEKKARVLYAFGMRRTGRSAGRSGAGRTRGRR